MDLGLENRAVLITGGSVGIGLAGADKYDKLFSLFNKAYDALIDTFRLLAEINRNG
jgi:hypothetical protein